MIYVLENWLNEESGEDRVAVFNESTKRGFVIKTFQSGDVVSVKFWKNTSLDEVSKWWNMKRQTHYILEELPAVVIHLFHRAIEGIMDFAQFPESDEEKSGS